MVQGVKTALILFILSTYKKVRLNNVGNISRKNEEGYSDPTAYAALSKISREEQIAKQLKKILSEVAALSGFRLKGQILLVDKKSGNLYKL